MKRVSLKSMLALCCALCLLAGVAPLAMAEEVTFTYAMGDIDDTAGVSAADALLALQIATKKVTADAEQTTYADVDGNGEVTANDALLILQYATKKVGEFPDKGEIRTAGNPIFTDIFTADPSAHVWNVDGDDRLYVYASHDQYPAQGCDFMDKYHIFSTSNMVDWYDHGEILSSDDVEWGREEGGFMWAPDAAYKDGTYYYYFPHPIKGDDPSVRSWRVGVATSDKPAEDFAVVTQKADGSEYQGYLEGIPYLEERPDGKTYASGLIDPCVFQDDDGSYYLYIGGSQHCYMAKMTDDMLGILPETWTEITDQLPEFHEGPWMFKRNGIYYLMYPDNTSGANKMLYATATSPTGPFTPGENLLLDSTNCDTSHGSVVEYKGRWYLFYHNSDLSGKGNLRSVCVDELFFNEDGSIQTVVQTTEGVKAIGPAETGKYAPNPKGALDIDADTIAGYLETYNHAYEYNLNFAEVGVDGSKLTDDQKNEDGSPKESPRIEGAGETRHTVNMTSPGSYIRFDGIVGGKEDGKALLEIHYSTMANPQFMVKASGMAGGIASTETYYMRMDNTTAWTDYTGVAYCMIDLKAGAGNSILLEKAAGGANFTYIRVYLPGENVDPTLAPKDPTVVDYTLFTGPATAFDFTGVNVILGTTSDDPANKPELNGDGSVRQMQRAGSYVEVSGIDGGRGGLAMVTIHYGVVGTGTLQVSANGVKEPRTGDVYFESTPGGWSDYSGKLTCLAELKAGTENVIRFTGGRGGINLKDFTVTLLPQE